jgi:SAM-dependent methyltransferase
VIHHCQNTEKAISEIFRILKPKGKCYIAVYHKNSFFFWLYIYLSNFILKQGWKKRNLQEQISLLEYPNNNQNLVAKLHKKKEFEFLFKNFGNVKCKIKHLLPSDIPILGRFYKNQFKPTPFLSALGNFFGWYIIVEATK